jgi:hypothetical protein
MQKPWLVEHDKRMNDTIRNNTWPSCMQSGNNPILYPKEKHTKEKYV